MAKKKELMEKRNMPEISQSQKNKERYRLEGALGYAIRIAQRIQNKTANNSEEISEIINADFKDMSSALSFHCKDNLVSAGFAVGLFDDELTQKAKQPQK